MSISIAIMNEDYKNVHIKSEPFTMAVNETSSAYGLGDVSFDRKTRSVDDRLEVLSNLIETNSGAEKMLMYRIQRVNLLFQRRQWQAVLDDIAIVESSGILSPSIGLLKIKASLQYHLTEARRSIAGSLLTDDYDIVNESMELLRAVNQMDENIQNVQSSQSPKKKSQKRFKNK